MQTTFLSLLAASLVALSPAALAVPDTECKPDVQLLGEAESDCLAVVGAGTAKGGIAIAGAGETEGEGLCITGAGAANCHLGMGIVPYGCANESHHQLDPTCPGGVRASFPDIRPPCSAGIQNNSRLPIYAKCDGLPKNGPVDIPTCGAGLDAHSVVFFECNDPKTGRHYIVYRAGTSSLDATTTQTGAIPTCTVGADPPGFFRAWAGCFHPDTSEKIVWLDTYDYLQLADAPGKSSDVIPTCGAGLSEMGFPAVWIGFDPGTGEEVIWINSWALICRGRC